MDKFNPKNLPIDVIPKGPYCYASLGPVSEDGMKIKVNGLCPYWSKDPNLPAQSNGVCEFLGMSDEDIGCGLLWDQCKECGINHYEEEDEDC